MIALALAGVATAPTPHDARASDSAELRPVAVGSAHIPTAADLSALGMLSSARAALLRLETLPAGIDRRAAYHAAIEGLVGLHELHGCDWAVPKLAELFAQPDCPDVRMGWSSDGTVLLRIEPLELQNPVFSQWTVLLLTLQVNRAGGRDLPGGQALRIVLRDGRELYGQALTPQHELWPNLVNLAPTFDPPHRLPEGMGLSFKQLIAGPKLDPATVAHVEWSWDDGVVRVPYLESR